MIGKCLFISLGGTDKLVVIKRSLNEWQMLLQTYSDDEIVETAMQIQENEDNINNVLVDMCKTGLMSYEAMNQMLLAYIASKDHTAITDYNELLHQGLIRRRGVRLPHQIYKDKGRKPLISISEREYPKPETFNLSVEDVWGRVKGREILDDGMIVSRTGQLCPYFQDVVPFRSVTVLCNEEHYKEVIYWLQKIHGTRCITNIRAVMDGRKLAIRSEEQI